MSRRWLSLFFLCVLASCGGLPLTAWAQGIEVREFRLEAAEQAYVVNADFEVTLAGRTEEALSNGVPLTFVVEFELTRPRWYWFDEKAASTRLEARLSFNPLLRQYRITTGTLQRNFSAIGDALVALGQIRGWPVIDRDRLQVGEAYVASLRMRLDTTQLPKPFQISALTEREWSVTSVWRRINVTAADTERASR